MRRRVLVPLLALAFVLAGAKTRAGDEAQAPLLLDAAGLPPGWKLVRTVEVPADRLAPFAGRLGGRLEALANQFLDVNGIPAQLNALRGVTEADADAVEQTLVRMRGGDFVARRGRDVFEVAGTNVLLAARVLAARGVASDAPAVYRLSLRLALVDRLVERERNQVFNRFLALDDDPGVAEVIREETADWQFGDTLRLRAPAPPVVFRRLAFVPEPLETKDAGGVRTVRFGEVERVAGVPAVRLEAEVAVAPAFAPRPGPAPAGLARATDRWPRDPVAAMAREAVAGVEGDRARLLALLGAFGARVRHGGATGSRDPVDRVLARGYGSCFDRSDVFVAACRSVGLPARLLAGWVPPLGAGHVWTEVHLEGEGWLPVDATTSWLGVSRHYIPLFETDEGDLPFLYVAWPQIERLEVPGRTRAPLAGRDGLRTIGPRHTGGSHR